MRTLIPTTVLGSFTPLQTHLPIRVTVLACCFLLTIFQFTTPLIQAQTPTSLQNGSMEKEDSASKGSPEAWFFPSALAKEGISSSLDLTEPFEGKYSTLIDTTKRRSKNPQLFGMLNQYINPKDYRGKRVRFRAAVRTAERSPDGRAQLWLRVDRKSKNGAVSIGAFENMDARPITSDKWKHYEIVIDIDDDAERMTVGMLVFAKTKAWIDDVSLEVIEKNEAEPTAKIVVRPAPRRRTSRAVSSNGSVASTTQPFFTHWLWLAVITIGLFAISQLGLGWSKHGSGLEIETRELPFFQKLAIKFSVVYWVVYCFPRPFTDVTFGLVGLAGKLGIPIENLQQFVFKQYAWLRETGQSWVTWTAQKFFDIEGELVFPTGSGDTTFAYVHVFICFVVAITIGSAWSLVMIKRKTDHDWLNDLTRTYLRYFLAAVMLSYGLHKTGFIQTQFAAGGAPSDFQLNRTYGDSSPMGLLWTFMAASPAYTFFGGLGEVIGGVLIVFRRTATLGALVVFGVMLNVMMLNYCYDVPVKLFSTHLVVMAVFVALPDIPRLANVLFFNRTVERKASLDPPYTGPKSIWIYRFCKLVIIIAIVAIPVYEQVKKEVSHEHPESVQSDSFLMNRGYRWISEHPLNR
ncbi:MAG: DoxX family protein [Mariniblastus sp.]